MSDDAELLDALTRAVSRAPDDTVLRRHVAETMLARGHSAQALPHLDVLLAARPDSRELHILIGRAIGDTIVETPTAPDDHIRFDWSAAESQF